MKSLLTKWRDKSYVNTLIYENKLSKTPYEQPLHSPNPTLWSSDQITFCWLGHATVLINFYGIVFITDPVLFNRIAPPVIGQKLLGIRRITKLPLTHTAFPPIDFVLISHAHYDHLDMASLNSSIFKDHPPLIISPAQTKQMYAPHHKVFELSTGHNAIFQSPLFPELKIKAFDVEHYGFVPHGNRAINSGANGYLISLKNKNIAFFGDTSYAKNRDKEGKKLSQPQKVNWHDQVREHLPSTTALDLGILPIGDYLYAANHISPQEAVHIANETGCKKMLPIHYDTFILSSPSSYQTSPLNYLQQVIKEQNFKEQVTFQDENQTRGFPACGRTCILD